MDNKVNTKILMFGAWGALLYPGLLILGWLMMAGFVPPPQPTASASDIVNLYQQRGFGIRAGMVVTMFGAVMYLPLGATLSYFITRIEGFFGPLSILQVMGAVCTAILTFYPAMWWLISIYRPDRPADITLMLSDASWLQWVGGLSLYYPSILTIAVASFMDKSPEPVFPRWFGYANLWVFMLLLPGQMIFFFKSGPFAWFPVAFYLLRKAVLRLEARETKAAWVSSPV
jgi:hypothetical protein